MYAIFSYYQNGHLVFANVLEPDKQAYLHAELVPRVFLLLIAPGVVDLGCDVHDDIQARYCHQ